MEIKNVASFDEMQGFLKADGRNYVLLYKKGSEVSDCSYNSLLSALQQMDKVNVLRFWYGEKHLQIFL